MNIPVTMCNKDEVMLLEQQALSRMMAMIFQAAAKKYELLAFTIAFLDCPLFEDFFINHTIFSQSPLYTLELFEEKLSEKNISIPPNDKNDTDIAYWMGYIFAEWYQEFDFAPNTLTAEQFFWLYENYDIFHTQSIRYVAELLIDEHSEEK